MPTPCGFSSPIVFVLFHTASQYALGKTDWENCRPLDWKKNAKCNHSRQLRYSLCDLKSEEARIQPLLSVGLILEFAFFFFSVRTISKLHSLPPAVQLGSARNFENARGVYIPHKKGHARVLYWAMKIALASSQSRCGKNNTSGPSLNKS